MPTLTTKPFTYLQLKAPPFKTAGEQILGCKQALMRPEALIPEAFQEFARS